MNPADMDAIAYVSKLTHRTGSRHDCKCEECRALKRVVALAREAVAMKAARRRVEAFHGAENIQPRRPRKAPLRSLPNAPASKYLRESASKWARVTPSRDGETRDR